MNSWDQIKKHLEAKLSAESYDNWVSRTFALEEAGGELFVSVPNRETKTWLETEYCTHVRAAVQELNLRVQAISYELQPARAARSGPTLLSDNGDLDSPVSLLNPKFTFDAFVV